MYAAYDDASSDGAVAVRAHDGRSAHARLSDDAHAVPAALFNAYADAPAACTYARTASCADCVKFRLEMSALSTGGDVGSRPS